MVNSRSIIIQDKKFDPMNKVVITGIGLIASGVDSKNALVNSIQEDSFDSICLNPKFDRYDAGDFYTGKALCIDFKANFPKLAPPFPKQYSKIGLVAAKMALTDAGLLDDTLTADRSRMGLIVNTTLGANEAVEEYLGKLLRFGAHRVSPILFTQTVANCALGDITRNFSLQGPSSLVFGENSATYAYDMVVKNKADIMLAGGFDQMRDSNFFALFKENLLLTNEDLKKESVDAINQLNVNQALNKTVFGNASVFLVLENKGHALKRGAKIYAEMVDYATSIDSQCNKLIHKRDSNSITKAIEVVLNRTGKKFSDIHLIYGSSCLPWQIKTYELNALEKFITTTTSTKPIFTTIKPKIGETMASSGELSLACCALSLNNGTVSGTGFKEEVFNCKKISVPEKTTQGVDGKFAIANSIYTGGNISSILLQKHDSQQL